MRNTERTWRPAIFSVVPLPIILLLAVLVVAALVAATNARAGQAGVVNRVQGQAEALRQGGRTPLAPGCAVQAGDVLSTGPEARLAVRFSDGTLLTLGENTRITVDEYVYDPDGSLILDMAEGAFRIISGEIARANPEKFAVRTPLATIGIRGTDFWGGFLETGKLDVLLIHGTAVTVSNPGGVVTLDQAGTGLTVGAKDRIPMLPKEWSREKTARALSTVTFD